MEVYYYGSDLPNRFFSLRNLSLPYDFIGESVQVFDGSSLGSPGGGEVEEPVCIEPDAGHPVHHG